MRVPLHVAALLVLVGYAGCEHLPALTPAPWSSPEEEPLLAQVVQPPEEETTPALDCYLAAEDAGVDEWRALNLCQNARSTGPVACYLEAEEELLRSEQQNVALCRCAISTEPVECFLRADRETMLSDEQISGLCNATDDLGLGFDCLPREEF